MKVAIFINNKFCCVTFSVKIVFVEEAASYNINTVEMAWEHLKIQCSESANHAVPPFLILKRERPLSTTVASNRPTEALASVISFTFVVYSHYKHS